MSSAPPIILHVPEERHPARRHKTGYVTVAVIEVVVALTIIIIGGVSLQKAQTQLNEIVASEQNGGLEPAFGGLPQLQNEMQDHEYGDSQQNRKDLEHIVMQFPNAKKSIDAGTNLLLGIGIGAGVWFLITSTMAMATATCPNNCNVIAGMVLCIFSSIVASFLGFYELVILLGLEVTEGDQVEEQAKICHILFIVCTTIMFVTSIVHAALCCGNTCCKPKNGRTIVTQHTIPMEQGYPPQMTPYYDNPPSQIGYVPEYVDDRMTRKLIAE